MGETPGDERGWKLQEEGGHDDGRADQVRHSQQVVVAKQPKQTQVLCDL